MKQQVILLFAAASVFAGCDKLGGGGSKDSPENVKFTCQVETWGSSHALERGDRAGLFAGAPLNVNNLPLTVGDFGSLAPDSELAWVADSTVTNVDFLAYTPYSSAYRDYYVTFSVSPDQTSDPAQKQSDLMIAKASVKLLAKSVDFSFSHKMVRVALYFQNNTTDPISSVTLPGVRLCSPLDLKNGAVSAADSSSVKGNVALGLYRNTAGREYYAAIIPPQTADLKVDVTFNSGKTSTLSATGPVDFSSGQQWDNASSPIVLSGGDSPDPVPAFFTLSVNPWEEGTPLNFVKTK